MNIAVQIRMPARASPMALSTLHLIMLIAYLIIAVLFAALVGAELGAGKGIIAGFLWPLTAVWFAVMFWVGMR